METKKVLIGIQARSTSSRLPGKALEQLGNKTVLGHVVDACLNAARYLNKNSGRKWVSVSCFLLIPEGDKIGEVFADRIPIFHGDEQNVLSRYVGVVDVAKPDYICRITGDCPLIPPYVISKHINIAIANAYDYVSNVDEECRLTLDGMDCEVLSAKMMRWLSEIETTEAEREHVTLAIRARPPQWAELAFTASHFDQSALKLSVDTAEDLARVRRAYEEIGKKLMTARRIYGAHIHRF